MEDGTVAGVFLLNGHPGRCFVPDNIIILPIAVELDYFLLTFLLLLADVDVPDKESLELVYLLNSQPVYALRLNL